jgi:hypothetical protein
MKTRPPQRTNGTALHPAPAPLFPEIQHAKKRAMLGAMAHCLSVTKACEQTGVTRKTHYEWCHTDTLYAAAVMQARALGAEWLEDMAIKRATEGDHPSDTLLIFLLKGAKPEQYRETQRPQDRTDVSELLKAVLLELADRSQARDVTPGAAWAPVPPGERPRQSPRPPLPAPPGLDDDEAR